MKGKESIHSTPPEKGTSSQQTPYFEEIVNPIIRMIREAWEGFNK